MLFRLTAVDEVVETEADDEFEFDVALDDSLIVSVVEPLDTDVSRDEFGDGEKVLGAGRTAVTNVEPSRDD